MAPEVDEPAVVGLIDRPAGANRLQPVGERGTAAAGVHHEVGDDALAGVGHHPDDVGDVTVRRLGGGEPAHGDAAADLDSRLVGGEAGEGRLDHGAAPGDLLEAFVAVAPPTGYFGGSERDRVDAQGARGVEGTEQVGELPLRDLSEPGEEIVR